MMRTYYKSTAINFYGKHNIWYIENNKLFLYTHRRVWEEYYSFMPTDWKVDTEWFVSEQKLEEITKEEAFIEVLCEPGKREGLRYIEIKFIV